MSNTELEESCETKETDEVDNLNNDIACLNLETDQATGFAAPQVDISSISLVPYENGTSNINEEVVLSDCIQNQTLNKNDSKGSFATLQELYRLSFDANLFNSNACINLKSDYLDNSQNVGNFETVNQPHASCSLSSGISANNQCTVPINHITAKCQLSHGDLQAPDLCAALMPSASCRNNCRSFCNNPPLNPNTSMRNSRSYIHDHFHPGSNAAPLPLSENNWQATKISVKERGNLRQRIPAHKFVLSIGSAVFDAMFNGSLSTEQDEIELPDVEPQAFLSLLKFLYTDMVHIEAETVMAVLYTAKKYAVTSLEKACVEFLKKNVSADNAFMLLTQARLFDEPQLATLCLETIDKNATEAILADGFTDIDLNTLCHVLERDTLRVKEINLFQAIARWSRCECERQNLPVTGANQRKVLGRAFYIIRFPLMNIEEFAQEPAQSNLMTDQEKVSMFLYYTVNPKPYTNFPAIPRCCITGMEQVVRRFQQIDSRWGYSGTSDRIRFFVDKRIFVVGLALYGSIHYPNEYDISIQIVHAATDKVCAGNDTTYSSDGFPNTFRVMFKETVEILPNTMYTAVAMIKGPDSHYGTKGLRKVVVEGPSGDRVTFLFSYAAGNNNGTSVEEGQLPEIIFHT